MAAAWAGEPHWASRMHQDCVRFIRLPDQLIQQRIKHRFIPFLLWNWLTSPPSARERHKEPTQARPLTAERARAHARWRSARRNLGGGHSCSQDTVGNCTSSSTSAGTMCEGFCVLLHIIIISAPTRSRILTRALKIWLLFSIFLLSLKRWSGHGRRSQLSHVVTLFPCR